jgi:hypothetical protein
MIARELRRYFELDMPLAHLGWRIAICKILGLPKWQDRRFSWAWLPHDVLSDRLA